MQLGFPCPLPRRHCHCHRRLPPWLLQRQAAAAAAVWAARELWVRVSVPAIGCCVRPCNMQCIQYARCNFTEQAVCTQTPRQSSPVKRSQLNVGVCSAEQPDAVLQATGQAQHSSLHHCELGTPMPCCTAQRHVHCFLAWPQAQRALTPSSLRQKAPKSRLACIQ